MVKSIYKHLLDKKTQEEKRRKKNTREVQGVMRAVVKLNRGM